MLRAHPTVQQTQVVIYFGDRPHRRAGVLGGAFLFDGNRRRQATDEIYLGLFELAEELPGIG